jgi:hypothetical protein
VDDITCAIAELTLRVWFYRIIRRELRSMSRLSEKLAAAAAVAPRQHAKIEERADRVIAREPEIERQTDQAFILHERMLDDAENGLAALERELATMSNNPPLEHSAPSAASPEVGLPVPTFRAAE